MPSPEEEAAAKENDKKLADQKAEIKELKDKLEKEAGRVQGAEKKFADWSNELGEMRKEREALKETLTEAQNALVELKAAPKPSTEQTKVPEKSEDTDTIEKSLSDDQRKTGEERFEALSEAEKLQYESDPLFKLAFLKRIQEVAPIVPTSPWKTVAKKKDDKDGKEYNDILDRVFNKKKQSSFVPPGSTGGITRMVKGEKARYEPPEDTRVT